MFPADEGQNVTPKVTWTEVLAVDVLSALKTIPTHDGIWCTRSAPGARVATYLRWARTAIDAADRATDKDTRERHAVEALIHAKRALDYLFDQYLKREWLHLHLGDRPSFSDRLRLLGRRFGNRFPWRLIPRVVADPRNEAEHEYTSPTVDDAGAAVEAAESIAAAMPINEMTFGRPAVLNLPLSWRGTPGEADHRFLGFVPHRHRRGFGLCWQGKDGVVRLSVGRVIDSESAEVTWCSLRTLSVAQHIELVTWWDACCGQTWSHELGLRPCIEIAGIDGPPA